MIFHLTTLAFVCLKLAQYIHWSWWLVFAPSILWAVLYFAINTIGSYCLWKAIKG